MNLKIIGCFGLLSLIIWQCSSGPNSKEMTVEQLANNVCRCSQSLITYNEELRQLADQSDTQALISKMSEGDSKMSEAVFCITRDLRKEISNLITTELEVSIHDACQLDKRMTLDLLGKIAAYKIPE